MPCIGVFPLLKGVLVVNETINARTSAAHLSFEKLVRGVTFDLLSRRHLCVARDTCRTDFEAYELACEFDEIPCADYMRALLLAKNVSCTIECP